MSPTKPERVTVPVIRAMKKEQKKICALTAYDFTFAQIVEAGGIDVILVGDSVASVVQGHPTTLPVTLDEMIYHTRCVARGVVRPLVVADMPFMSYQVSVERALESAGRLIKEGGAAAVKLEGGVEMAATIARLVAVDIPVMGHVGLTPQSVHRMGGFKVQGRARSSAKTVGSWERVRQDAKAVAEAGAFSVVIEGVPPQLAAEITAELNIPTIGIGAGAACDGQILVLHDMLGLLATTPPRFVKHFGKLREAAITALEAYRHEVSSGSFPGKEHEYRLPETGVRLVASKGRRAT